MEQKVTVVRDGHAETLLSRLLVPGDVVLLLGGAMVPADVDWLEGDILSIDTSAITGEVAPRKYPSTQYGKRILAGMTVQSGEAYCLVCKTGSHTEIGGSQEDVMHDKASIKKSLFETKILEIVKVVILFSLLIAIAILLIQGLLRKGFTNGQRTRTIISSVVSLLVASVPVALPLVLQVTMAIGAGKMARDFNAVVTSLSALQDISSMSILCSDKTGTLTTARISVHAQSIWCAEHSTFKPFDAIFYSRLASNPDKEDDPVDRCCLDYFRKHATDSMKQDLSRYKLVRSVGFNPVYKRVIFVYSHPEYGVVTIAKGLPNKIVDTADGGKDDADDQWKVVGSDSLMTEVSQVTETLSNHGYKTLGVAVRIGLQPWKFVGIIPLLDPPRHDSISTIQKLKLAGVTVKMITGDHENIARETARILGMSTNILKGEDLRSIESTSQSAQPCNDSQERVLHLIWEADGFAQVLPRDKRFVVEVLRNHYHAVVGMTGDGVNDAPALSAAQCGIAVENATDAAKNAAAILLTTPGLSAIYSAVVESRKIFRKLRAYIVYRIAAAIQIVFSLMLLIFISNCEINSLFVILLALFNDLTLLPIAYDRQQASATPDTINISHMLLLSLVLGITQTIFTMLWAYGASHVPGLFKSNLSVSACPITAQNAIWVQMTVSTELLIFSTRASSLLWVSYPPSPSLLVSVLLGSIIISVLAGAVPAFGPLPVTDILLVWAFTIFGLFVSDLVKCITLWSLGEKFAELEEVEDEKELSVQEEEGGEEEEDKEKLEASKERKPKVTKGEEETKQEPIGQYTTTAAERMGWSSYTIAQPRPQSPTTRYQPGREKREGNILNSLRTFSEEAIAFDVELGRKLSERELLHPASRWSIKAESTASEEKFQDFDTRRRQKDSQLRRVESWLKYPTRVSPSYVGPTQGGNAFPTQYQTAVSDALKSTARRSLSGGDILHPSNRTPIFGPTSASTAAATASPPPATIEVTRIQSAPASLRTRYAAPTSEERQRFVPLGVIREGQVVLPSNYAHYNSWADLRRPHITASSLRPHTPASRSITMTDHARQSLQTRLRSRSHSQQAIQHK